LPNEVRKVLSVFVFDYDSEYEYDYVRARDARLRGPKLANG